MTAFTICAIPSPPLPRPLIHRPPCPGHQKKAKRYLFGLFNRQQSFASIISAWAAVDKLFIGNFSPRICFTLRDTVSREDYFKATRNYDLSIAIIVSRLEI